MLIRILIWNAPWHHAITAPTVLPYRWSSYIHPISHYSRWMIISSQHLHCVVKISLEFGISHHSAATYTLAITRTLGVLTHTIHGLWWAEVLIWTVIGKAGKLHGTLQYRWACIWGIGGVLTTAHRRAQILNSFVEGWNLRMRSTAEVILGLNFESGGAVAIIAWELASNTNPCISKTIKNIYITHEVCRSIRNSLEHRVDETR